MGIGKKWRFIAPAVGIIFLVIIFTTSESTFAAESSIPSGQGTIDNPKNVPSWVINNIGWWAEGQISDADFIQTAQFLIDEGYIPELSGTVLDESLSIPDWIKNNAKWWVEGQLSWNDFVDGIKFMAQETDPITTTLSDGTLTQATKIPNLQIDRFALASENSSIVSLYIEFSNTGTGDAINTELIAKHSSGLRHYDNKISNTNCEHTSTNTQTCKWENYPAGGITLTGGTWYINTNHQSTDFQKQVVCVNCPFSRDS